MLNSIKLKGSTLAYIIFYTFLNFFTILHASTPQRHLGVCQGPQLVAEIGIHSKLLFGPPSVSTDTIDTLETLEICELLALELSDVSPPTLEKLAAKFVTFICIETCNPVKIIIRNPFYFMTT